jgi:penicillin-binding protein 2
MCFSGAQLFLSIVGEAAMGAFNTPQRPQIFSGPPLLLVLLVVLFCIFGIRLWYLQIYKSDFYQSRAQENRTRQSTMFSPRGIIRDRDGVLLAENTPAYALALVREDCPDIPKTLDQISRWTGQPRDELQKAFEIGRKRVKHFDEQVIVPNIPFELVALVEAHRQDWPGLVIAVRPKRSYAHGKTLAHVLGYVARANEDELNNDPDLQLGDNVGKQGVELVLERRLRGTKGLEEFEVDASGRVLSSRVVSSPVKGEDLTLSISLSLQEVATKALDGRAGSVVAMNADTGEVLALVSLPSYDPNEFVVGISHAKWNELLEDPLHPLQNRPVQSAYPPGSIFKLVVGGLGLESGVSPSKTVFCSGSYTLGKRVFRCWNKGGHGVTDFKKSLRESCDVYYYQLGEQMGVDAISDFATRCGFGIKTGIELPHERAGNMPTSEWKMNRFGEKWQGGETLNFAIGQGYTQTTPLQAARFVAALVNDGKILRPTLLMPEKPEVLSELPMRPATRKRILDAMVATVEEERGTARVLRRNGLRIGGKTGTAQVVRLQDKYEKKKTHEIPYKYRDHAWMASFGEKDGKRYVVVSMVEHGGHGGSDAGPVAAAVLDALLDVQPAQ